MYVCIFSVFKEKTCWIQFNLSSLIGSTVQQCVAERYLISLIIIFPPDQSPPPDCCPSPNSPFYRVRTDQIHCACGFLLAKKVVGNKTEPTRASAGWREWATLWQMWWRVSTERPRCSELTRPGDAGANSPTCSFPKTCGAFFKITALIYVITWLKAT